MEGVRIIPSSIMMKSSAEILNKGSKKFESLNLLILLKEVEI